MHLSAVLLLLAGAPIVAGPLKQAPLNTPANAVREVLADIQTLPVEVRQYTRYLWASDETPVAKLLALEQSLTFISNSLSKNSLIIPVVRVGTRIWRLNLAGLMISPKAFDRLGLLGSGRVPIPESYFHLPTIQVVEVEEDWEKGYYQGGVWVHQYWYKVKAKAKKQVVQAQAPWLPTKEILQLVAETQSEFPIYRADWFLYYATLEPRYHELLGVDDTKATFLKIAAIDEKLADKVGTLRRGIVLKKSEVAEHNRSLDRISSILRDGEAYLWQSNDYETSILGDDVLADPLNSTPAAQELIITLPNGLQAYLVVDGKGKRLDRAAINVARDKRTPLASVEVEIRNCFTCHARGMVPFKDEMRLTATGNIALGLRDLEKQDARKAQQIVDRFFSRDIAGLIQVDIQRYESAVKGVNGLAGAANALQFQAFLVEYERSPPVTFTLEDLARATGYPALEVRGVIERSKGVLFSNGVLTQKREKGVQHVGLDPSVLALANKEPGDARRDQIESVGFGQLMQLLTIGRMP